MIRRPPRSTRVRSSAASDVYKRQVSTSPPPQPVTPASISSCGLRQKPTFDPARTFAPCRESCIRADVLRHLPVVSQWPVHRQERPSAGGSGSSGHSTSSRQQQESTRQRVDSTLSLTTNSPQTPVDLSLI